MARFKSLPTVAQAIDPDGVSVDHLGNRFIKERSTSSAPGFTCPSCERATFSEKEDLENHVLTCTGTKPANEVGSEAVNEAAADGALNGPIVAPLASPFRKRRYRISLGLRSSTPLPFDRSDSEDEEGAKSVAEDPDAAIRPYVKGETQSYDQGDIADDISPEGDAEPKESEVVDTIEEDVQSVLGEEAPDISTLTQSIESSNMNPDVIADIDTPSATLEAVVVEEPTILATPSPGPSRAQSLAPTPTPSPSKNSILRTNSGLTGNAKKFTFPKFTDIEVFENYLLNAGDLSYEELYRRAGKVADVLLEYQKEYDNIDQEILDYETMVKAEARRAVEDAKEEADRILELEDKARDELQEKYSEQLLLKPKDWQIFLKALSSRRPIPPETLKHLNNLRNPAFMDSIKKRRSRAAPKTAKKLDGEPVPEHKLTKEEHDFEKRKLGRLMDPVRFDDMKMADVYGFEYSSHQSHYGNQPLDRATRQPQKFQRKNGDTNGISDNAIGGASTGRLRAQRTKTKRLYDVDDSATSDGEDEVPVKRARKPKVFEDGVTASNQRANTNSVMLIPAAKRTFPSGKRVGRPPKAYSASKLQAVQSAQELQEVIGEPQPAHIENNVGQIDTTGHPEAVPVKRKHAGGRPKKVVQPSDAAEAVTPKPKNKGGRPRKSRPQDTPASQDGTVMVSSFKEEPDTGANMVQLGDADDVMQSTEVEDASRDNSPSDSRPSTSSSSETASSFGGARRSARASTRTKTLARELSLRSDDVTTNADTLAPSSASSTKEKRKRGTAETEPSPIVVEAPFHYDEPTPKRRRTKAPKAEVSEDMAADMSQKRKRKSGAAHSESVAKKPKKPTAEPADLGDDENLDNLSPLARKELAAKKAQSEKSKKLSISTKARWASGGMAKAQETRRANLAIKKAAKEAAAAAAAADSAAVGSSSSNLVAIQPAPPAPHLTPAPPAVTQSAHPAQFAQAPQSTQSIHPILPALAPLPPLAAHPGPTPQKQQQQQQQPLSRPKTPTEGGRTPSTRVKRPSRIAAEYDEAMDASEDELGRFSSEYDRYQALTSSASPGLGKRVRKSIVDLSAMMGETSDEDYY